MMQEQARNISRRSFVIGAAALGVAACATNRPLIALAASGEASYSAGTYTAVREGQHGDIVVSVTVSDTSIEDVVVEECHDTGYISRHAVENLPRDVVAYQTTALDAVSGASMSSRAILDAVEDCLEQAGADVSALPEAPAPVEVERPDVDVDVLVVGSGGAGIMAACAAATMGEAGTDSGLSVMVIEKLCYAGGSYVLSGGGMLEVEGSDQHLSGEFDTITEDTWARFMTNRSNHDYLGCLDEALQRRSFHAVHPANELMIGLGAPYSNKNMTWVFPMLREEGDDVEGYSDNALAMLNYKPDTDATFADTNGEAFLSILDKLPNVELRCNVEATSLIVEDGAVAGVRVRETDDASDTVATYAIHAKKTILSTGSPNRNAAILDEIDFDLADAWPFCGAGSTGDGITLLREAGFEPKLVGNGGMCYMGTTLEYGMEDGLAYRPAGYPVVNIEARRYFDESMNFIDSGRSLAGQPDNTAYVIVDSADNYLMQNVPDHYDGNNGKLLGEYAVERGWAIKADTLEELAAGLGLDVEVFMRTMEAFASAAAGEQADECGASPDTMAVPSVAPFYAVTTHAVRPEAYVGIKNVSGTVQVAGADGQAIPGLYASGTLISPNLFYHRYLVAAGGLTIAFATGYMAGSDARDAILEG